MPSKYFYGGWHCIYLDPSVNVSLYQRYNESSARKQRFENLSFYANHNNIVQLNEINVKHVIDEVKNLTFKPIRLILNFSLTGESLIFILYLLNGCYGSQYCGGGGVDGLKSIRMKKADNELLNIIFNSSHASTLVYIHIEEFTITDMYFPFRPLLTTATTTTTAAAAAAAATSKMVTEKILPLTFFHIDRYYGPNNTIFNFKQCPKLREFCLKKANVANFQVGQLCDEIVRQCVEINEIIVESEIEHLITGWTLNWTTLQTLLDRKKEYSANEEDVDKGLSRLRFSISFDADTWPYQFYKLMEQFNESNDSKNLIFRYKCISYDNYKDLESDRIFWWWDNYSAIYKEDINYSAEDNDNATAVASIAIATAIESSSSSSLATDAAAAAAAVVAVTTTLSAYQREIMEKVFFISELRDYIFNFCTPLDKCNFLQALHYHPEIILKQATKDNCEIAIMQCLYDNVFPKNRYEPFINETFCDDFIRKKQFIDSKTVSQIMKLFTKNNKYKKNFEILFKMAMKYSSFELLQTSLIAVRELGYVKPYINERYNKIPKKWRHYFWTDKFIYDFLKKGQCIILRKPKITFLYNSMGEINIDWSWLYEDIYTFEYTDRQWNRIRHTIHCWDNNASVISTLY